MTCLLAPLLSCLSACSLSRHESALVYWYVSTGVPITFEPHDDQLVRIRLGDLSTNVDNLRCPATRVLPADGVENRLQQSETLSVLVRFFLCAPLLLDFDICALIRLSK